MSNPVLVEVKASTVEKRRVSEFNLNLGLKRPTAEKDVAKDAPKPAAKKG